MRSASSIRFALFAAIVATGPLAAQVREIPLGTPNASHPFEFSLIHGIREQANGGILAAASLDGVLMRIDPTFKRADTLGHKGRGPGEYLQPDGIWPLAADSSLLVDLGNNRLTVVAPNGKLGNTTPIMGGEGGGPGGPGGGITVMIPGGVDRSGGIYFRGGPGSDSVALNRFDRATQKTTRIANLKAAEMKRVESGGANSRQQRMSPVPLAAADGWAVSQSGTVFLVRSGTYRVEVIPRGGARRAGAPVAYTPVKIGEAERKEYSADLGRSGQINIGVENRNGEQTFSLSRGRPRGDDGPEASSFPAAKPPFDPSQLFVDGKERLWVRRYQPAGRTALYDVFNDQGALVSSIRLPAGRIVVGMGATSVYVAHINDDDLQLLERYPLPL
ncbi:MAG: hypothetical protein ABIZ70_14920 [Gemmatimonadales bacterium]